MSLAHNHIEEIQPFVNSIYKVDNLDADLHSIKSTVNAMMQEKSIWTKVRSGGIQTLDQYRIVDESFFHLFSKIDVIAQQVIKSWGVSQPTKLLRYWLNVKDENTYGGNHRHQSCILSGVFYLTVPENSGDITFDRPDDQDLCFTADFPNKYSAKKFSISPKENMLLLFPNFIRHEINKHHMSSNEQRIVIAFDYGLESLN